MKPTKQSLIEFYTAEGMRGDHQKNMYFTNRSPHSKKRFDRVKNLLKTYVSGKRFLELGCAEGLYCQEAERVEARLVVGLDISFPKIRRCLRGTKNTVYLVGDWDALPFAEDEFDVILLTEGLEHSIDPTQVLRNTRMVAKQLIITVPLEKNLMSDPLKEGANGHLHLFTHESIKALLKELGYEIKESFSDDIYFYAVCERK